MKTVEEVRHARLLQLKERYGSLASLNRALGRTATDSTLSQIANQSTGSRTLKPKQMGSPQARLIEEALELPRGWMDTDPSLEVIVLPRSQQETEYLPGFEELSIPVLAQTGSMGAGNEATLGDVVRGRLTVSPQWALTHVKPTDLKNLRFIHGYGDSMDPTFTDGDILLVDIGVKDPKIDGVYVMEANDRIYIKRVRQRMDGSFEVSSDNRTVKTVDVLNGSRDVEIHGRVVWCWNGKKM